MGTDPRNHYGGIARFFHWAIAAMIVLQFVLAELFELAGEDGERVRQIALIANHKSIGMTVLLLAALRLLWRFKAGTPALPKQMPGWQKRASAVSHVSLYALLFLLPVSGWLMSSASAYSVSWFGLFTWPDLIDADKGLKDVFETIHHYAGEALLVIALLHVGAAFKHHWFDRDDVLRRMTSVASLLLFAALIGVGLLTLTSGTSATAGEAVATDRAKATEAQQSDQTATDVTASVEDSGGADSVADETAADDTPAPLPVWQIDFSDSYIRFEAQQAGASFDGEWTEWQADLRFDETRLADSRFDVRVSVAGVDTGDQDRDSTLQDPDWFDSDAHPRVRFVADTFTRNDDDSFSADAEMQVKGSRHPVQFEFSVSANGDKRLLTGSARLDRLALDVGTGEWRDTTTVGQFVDVQVRVRASIAASP